MVKEKKPKLTEEQLKQKRREYMRKYYKRKKFQLDEGGFIKTEPQKPIIPPLKITQKEVVISFN
jgi:hypothetical protein